jgi:hypothetical protein
MITKEDIARGKALCAAASKGEIKGSFSFRLIDAGECFASVVAFELRCNNNVAVTGGTWVNTMHWFCYDTTEYNSCFNRLWGITWECNGEFVVIGVYGIYARLFVNSDAGNGKFFGV